jgi:membrane protease YdiL (CAAX protease family)
MNPLHELIRRLPPGVEFLIVVSWAFGLPIFKSILSIGGADGGGPARLQFTNSGLFALLILELVQSLFLIWFLRIRGWTLEKLGLQVSWRGTLLGSTLLAVTILVLVGVMRLADLLTPLDMKIAMERYPTPAADLNMQLVFLVSTVNGIFEEVFVAGYIITALTQVRGMWTGINVSTGVRLLCHLYQGAMGVLATVPMGLLFGFVYARTRQLWPLVFAHILMDIIGLSYRASGHSP